MDTFILGLIVGATLAIVGDYLATKYFAKAEARIKAEVADAEALKQSAENEIAKIEKVI